METGDASIYKDGCYIFDSGEIVSESDLIEGAQSLDNCENDKD